MFYYPLDIDTVNGGVYVGSQCKHEMWMAANGEGRVRKVCKDQKNKALNTSDLTSLPN